MKAARRLSGLGLLWTLTACTALPPAPGPAGSAAAPMPGSESASTSTSTSISGSGSGGEAATTPRSPSQSLLADSRAARAAGAYPTAAAALERALRITPADPALWVELAELRLLEGDPTQAAALAQKALTLAGQDRGTARRADAVLAAAGR